MLGDGLTDFISFLAALCMGVALCLVYDVFRIVRLANKPTSLSAFFQDIAYAVIAALLTFGLLLVRCNGTVRFFILAGEFFGFLTCRLTVSRLIMLVSDQIIRAVRAVVGFLVRILFRPAGKAASWVSGKLRRAFGFLSKKFLFFLKKALQPVRSLLYNITHNKRRSVHAPVQGESISPAGTDVS